MQNANQLSCSQDIVEKRKGNKGCYQHHDNSRDHAIPKVSAVSANARGRSPSLAMTYNRRGCAMSEISTTIGRTMISPAFVGTNTCKKGSFRRLMVDLVVGGLSANYHLLNVQNKTK